MNPSNSEKKSTCDLLADYVFSGDVSFETFNKEKTSKSSQSKSTNERNFKMNKFTVNIIL